MQYDPYTLAYYSLMATSIGATIAVVAMIRASRKSRRVERTVTLLKCSNCGYTLQRGFEDGDYVGRRDKLSCPRCGAPMYVHAIYVEKASTLFRALTEPREKHIKPQPQG